MESIIAYPESKKQIALLKSLLEEMKVRFKISESEDETKLSDKDFFEKIDKSIAQAAQSKTKLLSKSEQSSYLGL